MIDILVTSAAAIFFVTISVAMILFLVYFTLYILQKIKELI